MLRNYLRASGAALQLRNATPYCTSQRGAASKHSQAMARQGKIMSKLFGNRMTGSKKHWYPTNTNAQETGHAHAALFQVSQLGRATAGSGKNTARRVTVLNKLFMLHISDLLASGAIGEDIVGRGLQIQRVKISSDFATVNVYWLGSGDTLSDDRLAMELKRNAGLIRHELSQLRLMGEVPRIKFVHDRTIANLSHVDALLRNMDFSSEETEESGQESVLTTMAKQEFFGQFKPPEPARAAPEASFTCPIAADVKHDALEMRHDVLGLDQRAIMTKILAKMRKSQSAWAAHQQQMRPELDMPAEVTIHSDATPKQLERINQKLADAAETEAKFDEFLAKRRERKNTPQRKKCDRTERLFGSDANELAGHEEVVHLTPQRRRLLHEDDYIQDDDDSGHTQGGQNKGKSSSIGPA